METPDTTEQKTSMSAAFAAAGYRKPETHEEKLRRLMAIAVKADGPGRGVSGPSMARFEKLLLEEDDAELVWALFKVTRDLTVKKLFDEVHAGVRSGKKYGEDDLPAREIQTVAVSSPESGATDETNRNLSPPVAGAPYSVPTPRDERASHTPPGGGINGMRMLLQWQREGWLQRFRMDNKALGSMTFAEIERNIRERAADHEYLKLIRDSWPAYQQGGIVSDFLSDDDAETLYNKSRELAHAE